MIKSTTTGWLTHVKTFAAFLLSALHPYVEGETRENKVAYLDGLRGFAAFLVYLTHHVGFGHDADNKWSFRHEFGYGDRYFFSSLPFLRLFFHGGAFAVALFFVISGYVLSASPLSALHKHGSEGLRLPKQLGSSFPKRFVRLYLPMVATTFIFMSSWHLFGVASAAARARVPTDSYFSEAERWFREFIRGSYFFNEGAGFGASDYDSNMWSIAVELRGSFTVYVTILAFFALEYGPTARLYTCVGMFFYFQYLADAPYYALFIAGLAICDMDLLTEDNPQLRPRVLSHFNFLSKHRWSYHILLMIGLYLCGAPHVETAADMAEEPRWYYLSLLLPPYCTNARWFFAVWGAVLTVFSVPRITWIRRLFETQFCQYLGKISFGFYLSHGPVLWVVGDRVFAIIGRTRHDSLERVAGWADLFPISDWGPHGLEINFIVAEMILLPLTFCVAGVVTKLFDQPATRLSRWLFQPPSKKDTLYPPLPN